MASSFSENLRDAVRYWEPRRIVYNLVLVTVTILFSYGELFEIFMQHTAWQMFGAIVVMLAMAILANVLYCAAYCADLAAQATPFRDEWRERRGFLFAFGVLLACGGVVAFFFMPDTM